jgi:polyisoprenoid-binding protein YceI
MRLARTATFALVAFATPAVSAAASWEIDPSHAHVTFTADHLGFSVVHGQFRAFTADIRFAPENIAATQIAVTIDAKSIDTGWPARDEHLRSPDFLNVAAHPAITFRSTAVTRTGEATADIAGELTVIGVTRPATFKAVLNRLAPNPFTGEPTAGFTVTGQIRRADHGMTFGGDAFGAVIPVRVDLEIVAR